MSNSIGTLAKQTAVYGISTVLARLLSYLLVPYFTYKVMDQVQYGIYTYMYALIPLLLVVLTMGMESGYFRFAAKAEGEQDKRKVFATAWGAVLTAATLFMACVVLFRGRLSVMTDTVENPSYVWIVGLIVFFDVAAALPYARLREQGRAMRYVMLRLVQVSITVFLSLFFYAVLPHIESLSGLWDPTFNPGYAFVANLVSSAVTFVLLLPSCDRIAPRIDPKVFGQIFVYSLPLLISGVAGTANEYIDRQLIDNFMPTGDPRAALGVYGAVVKIAVVMVLFTQMYRLAAEPFFLSNFKKEDFRTTTAEAMKYYMIVSVLIFLFIALFADLFALIIGREFREGIYILPVVLLSNMLSGVWLNLSFWYKQTGQTKYAVYVTCSGLVAISVSGVLLVPVLGYMGAALARLCAELTMVVVSYALNQKYYPIHYDLRRIGEYLLLGGALYGLSLLLTNTPSALRYSLSVLMLALYTLYAVRREKIDIAKMMRSILHRKG